MDTPTPPKKPVTKKQTTGMRRMFRLAKKELIEILRDRRTIITLVMMPLLLYPLIGITVQKFLLTTLADAAKQTYRIGVEKNSVQYLEGLIVTGTRIIQQKSGEPEEDGKDSTNQNGEPSKNSSEENKGSEEKDTPTASPDSPEGEQQEGEQQELSLKEKLEQVFGNGPVPEFFVPEEDDPPLEELLTSSDELDIALLTKRSESGPYFEILINKNSRNSLDAAQWLIERFDAMNLEFGKRVHQDYKRVYQMSRLAPPPELRRFPAMFVQRKIESGSESEQSETPPLLTFIPLMLVLMTMTGAVYPAIDLTAGERERGTMEILVAAPVSRLALLFGKFVAVLAVAMLTAVFNITAMTITLYTLGLEQFVFGEAGLPMWAVFAILGLLFVFAGFFSATLLCLTSFARSFKEAQAYLIPLMLVSLTPGMLSLMPNVVLSPMLAIVPLVNIVMLSRDLLSGNVELVLVGIVVTSTVLYGFLALSTAARIFGTDSMLTGGGSTWADFFKAPTDVRTNPTISIAMLFMAVLFPSFIIIAGLASRIGSTINVKLLLNALVTFGLFVGLPILFASLFRIRYLSAFLLHRAKIASYLGAVLLGLSLWVIVYELEIYSLSKTRIEEMMAQFESTMKTGLSELSLPMKLFCLALVPAVCEEFTFRGFLMSAFRKRVHNVWAVIITAVLFGLFHVFVRDLLLFERMLPSTLMGIILGMICLRTGSVLPGMLLHVLHNGLLLTIAHFETELTEMGIGVSQQEHLPIGMIAGSILPIAIGAAIVFFLGKEPETNKENIETLSTST